MEKSDMMYYSAYLILFILLGVWFLFWLLSAGVLMIILGTFRTKEAPHGSSLLIGSGMLLSIVMLLFLAITTNLIGGWVGAALGIILIGITGFVILLMSMKGK